LFVWGIAGWLTQRSVLRIFSPGTEEHSFVKYIRDEIETDTARSLLCKGQLRQIAEILIATRDCEAKPA
jgi:hypothetical protein